MKTSLICLLLLAVVACAAPRAGEMAEEKREEMAEEKREEMAEEKREEMAEEKREEMVKEMRVKIAKENSEMAELESEKIAEEKREEMAEKKLRKMAVRNQVAVAEVKVEDMSDVAEREEAAETGLEAGDAESRQFGYCYGPCPSPYLSCYFDRCFPGSFVYSRYFYYHYCECCLVDFPGQCYDDYYYYY